MRTRGRENDRVKEGWERRVAEEGRDMMIRKQETDRTKRGIRDSMVQRKIHRKINRRECAARDKEKRQDG